MTSCWHGSSSNQSSTAIALRSTVMDNQIRWGILGTGTVAIQFAEGLKSLPEAQLLAVASRTLSNAEEYARAFGVPRCYSNYEQVVNDKDVDVVNVATPNSKHKEHCLLCFDAGKPVLCEKPFAL